MKTQDPVNVVNDTEWAHYEPAEYKNAPHSFVIYRGKVGRHIKELMKDIRRIMEPYTASKLQVCNWNRGLRAAATMVPDLSRINEYDYFNFR